MRVVNFEAKENMNVTIREREEKNIYYGMKAVCFDGEKMRELVDLRIGATQSMHYACVWIHGDKKWAYGSGKAGGYGYDRASAAAESAFRAAGVKFDGAFGSCGMTITKEAVKAMGEHLSNGLPVFVVEFYG